MRLLGLLLSLTLVVGAATACSDDAEAPVASGSRDAFCTELRAAVEARLTIFDPLQPVSVEDTEAATARLADAAPEAVAEDMTLLADTFADVVQVFDEVDPSDPEAAERLAALDIDQARITAAQTAVTAYALEECRIDLAAINQASVTTTSTTVPATTVPLTTVVATTVPPVVSE